MNFIDWLLGLGATLGVLSMYLRFRSVGQTFEFISASLAGIGLCLLAVSAAESPDWWPESDMDSAARQFVFWAMSLLCVLGAGLAVTANDAKFIAGGCTGLCVGTVGLLMLNDLSGIAAGLIVISAVLAWWFLGNRISRSSNAEADDSTSNDSSSKSATVHEPLLACVVGGVIGIVLLAAVREAMFEEAFFSHAVQNGQSLISKRNSSLPLVTSRVGSTDSVPLQTLIPLGVALCGFAAVTALWLRRQTSE